MLELLALISVAAKVGIAVLLGVAGVLKLKNFISWLKALSAYRLVPDWLLTPAAYAMPVLEIASATLLLASAVLIVPWLGQLVFIALPAALITLFSGAIAINLLRGRTELDCGCDPRGQADPISWQKVWLNLGLVALLAIGVMPLPSLGGPVTVMAAVTGLAGYVLLQCVGRLSALGQSLPKLPEMER